MNKTINKAVTTTLSVVNKVSPVKLNKKNLFMIVLAIVVIIIVIPKLYKSNFDNHSDETKTRTKTSTKTKTKTRSKTTLLICHSYKHKSNLIKNLARILKFKKNEIDYNEIYKPHEKDIKYDLTNVDVEDVMKDKINTYKYIILVFCPDNALDTKRKQKLFFNNVHKLLKKDGILFIYPYQTEYLNPSKDLFEKIGYKKSHLYVHRNKLYSNLKILGEVDTSINRPRHLTNKDKLKPPHIVRNLITSAFKKKEI